MKRGQYLFIGLIFFSPLTPLFFLSPVRGIGFSCSEFWFFINHPTTIEYDQMAFTVYNNHPHTIQVECTTEQVEGVNVSVSFDWETLTLSPDEARTNHYRIAVHSNLTVLYTLRIYVKAGAKGAQLTTGGIIVNYIQFYSDAEGAFLDLRVGDQAKTPRKAQVKMMYRKDESYPWSPFKEFNGSRLQAYVPLGMYEVRAWDQETGIYGMKTFTLTNDSQIDLILKLVGMELYYITNIYGDSGVNLTINNYVEELLDVEIYVELHCNDDMISRTPSATFSRLEQTDAFILDLWFRPFQWRQGFYSLVGYIIVGGVIIVTQYVPLGSPPNLADYTTDYPLFFIAAIIAIVAIATISVIAWRRKR